MNLKFQEILEFSNHFFIAQHGPQRSPKPPFVLEVSNTVPVPAILLIGMEIVIACLLPHDLAVEPHRIGPRDTKDAFIRLMFFKFFHESHQHRDSGQFNAMKSSLQVSDPFCSRRRIFPDIDFERHSTGCLMQQMGFFLKPMNHSFPVLEGLIF